MNQKFNAIRRILIAAVLFVVVAGLPSCEKYAFTQPVVDSNATLHFQTDIQPIFTANCITCHNGVQYPDLRPDKSYLALTKAGFIDTPGETSVLYHQMTTNTEHIPRSTTTDKLKVLYWINQGALNN